MNTGITSRQAILLACRRLVAERGLPALTTRAVADECGIALGTLYNYFADKDELMLAAIESVWQDIFHAAHSAGPVLPFPDYVALLFDTVRRRAAQYPGFLGAHAVSLARSRRGEARGVMDRTLDHMRAGLLAALRADDAVRPGTFDEDFSPEAFVQLILDHLLLLLVQGRTDCTALTGLICRILYR